MCRVLPTLSPLCLVFHYRTRVGFFFSFFCVRFACSFKRHTFLDSSLSLFRSLVPSNDDAFYTPQFPFSHSLRERTSPRRYGTANVDATLINVLAWRKRRERFAEDSQVYRFIASRRGEDMDDKVRNDARARALREKEKKILDRITALSAYTSLLRNNLRAFGRQESLLTSSVGGGSHVAMEMLRGREARCYRMTSRLTDINNHIGSQNFSNARPSQPAAGFPSFPRITYASYPRVTRRLRNESDPPCERTVLVGTLLLSLISLMGLSYATISSRDKPNRNYSPLGMTDRALRVSISKNSRRQP